MSVPPGIKDESRRTISSALLKSKMYWKKYSYETQGAFTEMIGTVGPGFENPKHYHTQFAESFTPIKGSLTITLDGQRIILGPGETATVHIGHTHSLINASDEDVEFTTRLEPGYEGFEQAMYIMHGLANDGHSNAEGVPNNPVSVAVMSALMDTWLTDWIFWAARPVLFVLRRYGEGTGEHKRLIEKYWE